MYLKINSKLLLQSFIYVCIQLGSLEIVTPDLHSHLKFF